MKRDLKGHDVKDLVFMWGFCTNVRATASNMTKLGCEVEDLFELLVKENTIKTKGWATQTKVLKCSKGTEKLGCNSLQSNDKPPRRSVTPSILRTLNFVNIDMMGQILTFNGKEEFPL